jgi:hypothetical protein
MKEELFLGIDVSTGPVALGKIRGVMAGSLNFVKTALSS